MANSTRKIAAIGALYLYGISEAPASAAEKPAQKPGQKILNIGSVGIDGVHAVKALACGDFICWVCEVDQASFADAVERNMENLEWLALHGVRHQQVVGEVAKKMTIVPARFGTVFSGEAALLKDVQGRKAALKKVFARVAGGDEWGVKVFAERQVAAVAMTEARSGKEYLRQKAARLKKRPERNDQELQELATALGKIATDSAPSGKVSGAQHSLLWQATFLVPRGKRKQWDQALKNFVERWEGRRRIEVNGPWPPYSFVSDAE
jgi:hypothetical protein